MVLISFSKTRKGCILTASGECLSCVI